VRGVAGIAARLNRKATDRLSLPLFRRGDPRHRSGGGTLLPLPSNNPSGTNGRLCLQVPATAGYVSLLDTQRKVWVSLNCLLDLFSNILHTFDSGDASMQTHKELTDSLFLSKRQTHPQFESVILNKKSQGKPVTTQKQQLLHALPAGTQAMYTG